jgi:hypothetical protein
VKHQNPEWRSPLGEAANSVAYMLGHHARGKVVIGHVALLGHR